MRGVFIHHLASISLERGDLILIFVILIAPSGKGGVCKNLLTDFHCSFYSVFSSIAVDTDRWKVMGKAHQGTYDQKIIGEPHCFTTVVHWSLQILERDLERFATVIC